MQGLMFDASLFLAATSSVLAFYTASQRETYRDWTSSLRYFPMLVALGIGMSVNNARAVLEAIFKHDSPFVRTPKYDARVDGGKSLLLRYAGLRQGLPLVELLFGLYFAASTALALQHRLWVTAFFLALFASGYLWVGIASLLPARRPKAVATAS
jgi:hypothetical protein